MGPKRSGDLCQNVSFVVSLREEGYSGSFGRGKLITRPDPNPELVMETLNMLPS